MIIKDTMTRYIATSIVLLASTFSAFASNLGDKIAAVGGTACLIQVQPNKDDATGEIIPVSPAAMDTARSILVKRLTAADTHNAHVSIEGNNIQIEFPELDLENASPLLKSLVSRSTLTIHKAHPQTNTLAPLVAAGEEAVIGYRAYPQVEKDENGVESLRHILASRVPALTSKDVAAAWPDHTTNAMVFVKLTISGAKKMEAFTRSLQSGRDQIVSILDGKVLSIAMLNTEVLSKHFKIFGLDNIEECERLAKDLSNPMENELLLIEMRRISASTSK